MAMHCDSCLWKENQFLFLNRESRFVKKKKKIKKISAKWNSGSTARGDEHYSSNCTNRRGLMAAGVTLESIRQEEGCWLNFSGSSLGTVCLY